MKKETEKQMAQSTSMTSLQIAEVIGRRHQEVMLLIGLMEFGWERACKRKFNKTSRRVENPGTGTKEEPCFSLNKTECLYIATKLNDEERAKLVLHWEKLEKKEEESKMNKKLAENAAQKIVDNLDPRDGYPSFFGYFNLCPVADLHTAILTLADFAKEQLHCRHTEKARNIRHQSNVALTFAKTLSANSQTLEELSSLAYMQIR